MSSNRLMYDSCAYKQKLGESTSPLNYNLYTGKYENCAKCRVEFGTVGGNGVSLFNGNLVDLESDLRGQTRPLSNCSNKKFVPKCSSNTDNSGIPCGNFYQNKNLVNQPACQLFRYPQMPSPPKQEVYKCDYRK